MGCKKEREGFGDMNPDLHIIFSRDYYLPIADCQVMATLSLSVHEILMRIAF